MKKFFLKDQYKKFRRRLFFIISIIVGLIGLISMDSDHPEEPITFFFLGIGLTWLVYGTTIWIIKALPD